MPAVMDMIRELAAFEKAEDKVEIQAERLVEDGFGKTPAFQCVLACFGEEVAGFCLSWFRYSTWRGQLLYVEDLYVKEKFRGKGAGTALLEAEFQIAKSLKIPFIHLQVLDWNTPAIEFYKKYDGQFDAEWLNVLLPVQSG